MTADGLTHASSVIAVLKCNEGVSGTLTHAELPLNERAPPYFPAVVQVASVRVPVFPVPEASAVVVPVPSLNEYAATKPDVGLMIAVGSLALLLAVLVSPPPLTVT